MILFDVLIIAGLTVFVYMGAKRGMIDELMGLTGWIIALLLAVKLGGPLAEIISRKVPKLPDVACSIIAFLVILFFVRAGFLMFTESFKKMVKPSTQTVINKFIGGLFGFVMGAFFVSVVVFAISVLPLNPKIKALEDQSVLFGHMTKFSRIVVDAVLKFVPEAQEPLQNMVEKIEGSVEELESGQTGGQTQTGNEKDNPNLSIVIVRPQKPVGEQSKEPGR